MEAKVSVVVPMYNVEKYLPTCIDSLINQTLREIEIILVDDGSPDNCGKIADEYAKKEERIKVVHQKNGGLGPARNSGMKVASGEYIGFVDSDDWVRPEMYERLYQRAVQTGADIVFGGHCDLTNGEIKKTKPHPLAGKVLIGRHEIDTVRKNLYGHSEDDPEVEAFPMRVWTGIYRTEMLTEHQLTFENIFSEDTIFNLSAYKFARCIAYTMDTDYCYRKDDQPSIVRSFSDKKRIQYIDFFKRLNSLAVKENDASCVMRVKRLVIDDSRLFVETVVNSNLSREEKKREIGRYAESKEIQEFWSNYPVHKLPWQQRIFQVMLEKQRYGMTILLNDARMFIKKHRISLWNEVR